MTPRSPMNRSRWLKVLHAQLGKGFPLRDGTPIGIECAVQGAVPWVKRIDWETIGPGQVIARVRMRWWAWATLGVLHYIGLARARDIIDETKPATVMVLVALW